MAAAVDARALALSLKRLRQERDATVLQASLQRIAESCVELFGLSGSGLMLADEHGELRYVASTDARSHLLEEVQIETGQGPCIESYVRADTVACDDVEDDERWPLLAKRLTGSGIGAVLGVPITLLGVPVGNLDVYHHSRHPWTSDERDALVRFGDVADAAITAAVNAEQAGALAEQLTYALDNRIPIERATGYLMARDGLDHAAAFQRLRRAARSGGPRIGEVAEGLLRTGRLPDDTD
jgi:GAF domain-containing protein